MKWDDGYFQQLTTHAPGNTWLPRCRTLLKHAFFYRWVVTCVMADLSNNNSLEEEDSNVTPPLSPCWLTRPRELHSTHIPDRPFPDFRASRSGNRRFFCRSESLTTYFYATKVSRVCSTDDKRVNLIRPLERVSFFECVYSIFSKRDTCRLDIM